MTAAIISYDIKNVQPHENIQVKAALLSFVNTFDRVEGLNLLQSFPQWVDLRMPDTTLLVSVDSSRLNAHELTAEVLEVIRRAGAEPDKIYVAFIDVAGDFLWNSEARPAT